MSNLVEHAKTELEHIGLFDVDSDYNGTLGRAILELVETFANQGHTGLTAPMAIYAFSKLAMFEPLSELTYAPDEWEDRSEISGYPLWQNKRDSRVFSDDGGKTHWQIPS